MITSTSSNSLRNIFFTIVVVLKLICVLICVLSGNHFTAAAVMPEEGRWQPDPICLSTVKSPCDTKLKPSGGGCGNRTICYYAHLNFCFMYCCDNEDQCIFTDKNDCEQSCVLPEDKRCNPVSMEKGSDNPCMEGLVDCWHPAEIFSTKCDPHCCQTDEEGDEGTTATAAKETMFMATEDSCSQICVNPFMAQWAQNQNVSATSQK